VIQLIVDRKKLFDSEILDLSREYSFEFQGSDLKFFKGELDKFTAFFSEWNAKKFSVQEYNTRFNIMFNDFIDQLSHIVMVEYQRINFFELQGYVILFEHYLFTKYLTFNGTNDFQKTFLTIAKNIVSQQIIYLTYHKDHEVVDCEMKVLYHDALKMYSASTSNVSEDENIDKVNNLSFVTDFKVPFNNSIAKIHILTNFFDKIKLSNGKLLFEICINKLLDSEENFENQSYIYISGPYYQPKKITTNTCTYAKTARGLKRKNFK
jgi:hypothetical protein